MKVLVINCGSSSLKYQLIDSDTEQVLAKGICERIKLDGSLTHQATGKEKIQIEAPMPDHSAAVKLVLQYLLDEKLGAIKNLDEIAAVGHRVVHGGEKFSSAVLINDEVLAAIEECCDLAPLHNPANLIGIRACQELMPGVPQVAVFDTAFHQTMPDYAYTYGIPYEYYEKYSIRRYGFHGTSHMFVSGETVKLLGKEDAKVIVCHIGNGASISASIGGKCVDTSMGLTPLEGLVMGTRSGDVDPAVLQFICNHEDISVDEMLNILNKKSGLLGISGVSSDFRDVRQAAADGNERAQLAMDTYKYRVAKYIGSYTAAMNGVDAITFTAGVGENAPDLRKDICDYLGYLGVELDEEKNENVHGETTVISTPESKVKVIVLPTNEELAIARETAKLV